MGSVGTRTGRALAAAAVAGALVLGLAACGSDSESAGTSATGTTVSGASVTATAPTDAGAVYVEALGEATRAMLGVMTATLDPGLDRGERGPRIEEELTQLETAAAVMTGLSLPDPEVDAEREALVEAVPPFTSAMRDVVAAGTEDRVNGGLELVQRREPILAGVDAVAAANAGALRALGEEARDALEEIQRDLERRLEDLRTQASG